MAEEPAGKEGMEDRLLGRVHPLMSMEEDPFQIVMAQVFFCRSLVVGKDSPSNGIILTLHLTRSER